MLIDAAQHVTRFIALAQVGNPDKKKVKLLEGLESSTATVLFFKTYRYFTCMYVKVFHLVTFSISLKQTNKINNNNKGQQNNTFAKGRKLTMIMRNSEFVTW